MDMDLSEEQLDEVKGFAALLFFPEEIATIMEIDPQSFRDEIKSKKGKIYLAFISGKLKTEAELRKTTLTYAKQGSSPALTASLKFLEKLDQSILKRHA